MEKIKALFILATIGDIIGYKSGKWEFNRNGEEIVKEFSQKYGSLRNVNIYNQLEWIYSDDTVLHLATLKAIIDGIKEIKKDIDKINSEKVIQAISKYLRYEYIYAKKFMQARAPGKQYLYSVKYLELNKDKFNVHYGDYAGGNGATIRTMILPSIMKKYLSDDIKSLVKLSYLSAIITHNNGIGIMGGILSSIFTYYGLIKIKTELWGSKFLKEVLPIVYKLTDQIKNMNEKKYLQEDINKFERKFKNYLIERNIYQEYFEPKFPINYENVDFRDKYYKKFSYDGWPGASGDDCIIIAYDCILYCKNNFNKLVYLSALHGGDNDSTATIACAFYGAINGFDGVPENLIKNFENSEYIYGKLNELFTLL